MGPPESDFLLALHGARVLPRSSNSTPELLAFGLLDPNALSAPAFEQVDDGPSVRNHHRSDVLELSTADTAGPAGLILDSSNLLSMK